MTDDRNDIDAVVSGFPPIPPEKRTPVTGPVEVYRDPFGQWMDDLEAWLIAQEDAALERARKEAPS